VQWNEPGYTERVGLFGCEDEDCDYLGFGYDECWWVHYWSKKEGAMTFMECPGCGNADDPIRPFDKEWREATKIAKSARFEHGERGE
jgi:hypothetical protein